MVKIKIDEGKFHKLLVKKNAIFILNWYFFKSCQASNKKKTSMINKHKIVCTVHSLLICV